MKEPLLITKDEILFLVDRADSEAVSVISLEKGNLRSIGVGSGIKNPWTIC